LDEGYEKQSKKLPELCLQRAGKRGLQKRWKAFGNFSGLGSGKAAAIV